MPLKLEVRLACATRFARRPAAASLPASIECVALLACKSPRIASESPRHHRNPTPRPACPLVAWASSNARLARSSPNFSVPIGRLGMASLSPRLRFIVRCLIGRCAVPHSAEWDDGPSTLHLGTFDRGLKIHRRAGQPKEKRRGEGANIDWPTQAWFAFVSERVSKAPDVKRPAQRAISPKERQSGVVVQLRNCGAALSDTISSILRHGEVAERQPRGRPASRSAPPPPAPYPKKEIPAPRPGA